MCPEEGGLVDRDKCVENIRSGACAYGTICADTMTDKGRKTQVYCPCVVCPYDTGVEHDRPADVDQGSDTTTR